MWTALLLIFLRLRSGVIIRHLLQTVSVRGRHGGVLACGCGGGAAVGVERLEHDDLLVGEVVQDCPVEEHVCRRHEVLDESEYAEG